MSAVMMDFVIMMRPKKHLKSISLHELSLSIFKMWQLLGVGEEEVIFSLSYRIFGVFFGKN